ncbi:hypothetical protein IQ230_01640 [Gloeocapsopsis crepidinum LEGE 06123]|uniref:LPXTG cell wall anchor domain-containing protein n=1 Tax=Gloeocapsopsis crepidinum LEGE 06123 TaxID=588587 RepID=A0ABR9UM33_9CHRO|nr:hypothetical protein [Gloeocapsopsis crepidinum]MBE9189088.1 hypothetical protein [Gloeocapsopsis crepidinum LEGE 06123]
MQGHKLNQNSLLAQRNFSNLTRTEINQNTATPNQVNIPNTGAFWGSLGLLTGGFIFLSMLSKLRKRKQSHVVIDLQQLNKIPCSNCRFFSSNPYLRCAVNPKIALTEEAINCADYCPQAKKMFH